ncbi:hydroxyacylglutathione hydrolase [bacterium]|nr:hydroxyacylglutathione hydrolase [bacterium]
MSLAIKIIRFAQESDNYAWLIVDFSLKIAALVDAVHGEEIQEYLDQHQLKLTHILNTHHHYDHVGANHTLFHEDLIVVGSLYDCQNKRIPHQNLTVVDGDNIVFGQSKVLVKDIVGHTLGHVGYYIEGHFFCGDTIFLAGCGRVFEGTHHQMFHSISSILDEFDGNTLIYPAHEYSMSNLSFALSLQNDEVTKNAVLVVQDRLKKFKSSLPSSIEDEKLWNPFYRVNDESYRQNLSCLSQEAKLSPELAFKEIRLLKDRF